MWRCVFVILLFLCAIAGPLRAVQPAGIAGTEPVARVALHGLPKPIDR